MACMCLAVWDGWQRTGEMLVVQVKCMAQLHAIATWNVEMSGCELGSAVNVNTVSRHQCMLSSARFNW